MYVWSSVKLLKGWGGGGGLEKNPFRVKDIMYGYFLELHKVNLFHEIQIAGFILEIGQWGSNGPPPVILGGPFSGKGVQERGSPKR